MSFIEEFKKRGYFYQATNINGLNEISKNKSIAAYIVFDCTAKSLHVGNLMQVMILRLMQKYGHKPIILVGGATTKIGDPTGKDEIRKILSEEDLQANIAGIKKSLSKFINFGKGESDALLVNNDDWLSKISYTDFLQKAGRYISVNRMLTMDSVKNRLDRQQPLTFLEFNYMVMQGYDFAHLNEHYNCILQMGGSDQWGNILSGVDLIHKMHGREAFGMTTPLLTTSSGAKMGKSVGGAVWLNEDMLTPYDYFQYWRNTEDADVIRFANLYAEWEDDQMKEFESLAEKSINEAKKQLAHRLTSMCHGEDSAKSAQDTAKAIFESGSIGADIPMYEISSEILEKGIAVFELYFEAGLSTSKSEARKLIRGGGAKINDAKIEDENMLITKEHLTKDGIKLSSGKKKHLLVKVV